MVVAAMPKMPPVTVVIVHVKAVEPDVCDGCQGRAQWDDVVQARNDAGTDLDVEHVAQETVCCGRVAELAKCCSRSAA